MNGFDTKSSTAASQLCPTRSLALLQYTVGTQSQKLQIHLILKSGFPEMGSPSLKQGRRINEKIAFPD